MADLLEQPSASGASEGTPELLEQLEGFFSDPAFTTAVSEFAANNARHFWPVGADGEHPLHWMEIYNQYTAMVEEQLQAFLSSVGLSVERVLQLALVSKEELICFDYLLASTEYERFLELMLDFNSMAQWTEEDLPGGELGDALEAEPGMASAFTALEEEEHAR